MIKRLLLQYLPALLVVTAITGCQIPHHGAEHCARCGHSVNLKAEHCLCALCGCNDSSGMVQTGGQFARPQSLSIGPEGLTLGGAVAASLRDGVMNSAAVNMVGSADAFESMESPVNFTTPGDWANAQMKFLDVYNDVLDIRDEVPAAEFASEKTSNRIDELTRTKAEDVFKFVMEKQIDDPDRMREPVTEMIAKEIRTAIDQQLDADSQSEVAEEPVDREFSAPIRESIFQKTAELASDLTVPTSAIPTPQVRSDMTYYQIAVRVRRRSGRTIVFPLWLVQRYQAGDIALRNGDLVEVVHYGRTGLLSQASQNEVSLRSLDANYASVIRDLDPYLDLFHISRRGSSGEQTDFYVPRNIASSYGDNPGYEYLLNRAYANPGQTRGENLDLVDVIRQGRREALSRTAEMIRPKTAAEAFDEGQRALQERIAALPVIGDLCQAIESTTGFNTADAISGARGGIDGVIGLLP